MMTSKFAASSRELPKSTRYEGDQVSGIETGVRHIYSDFTRTKLLRDQLP